MNRIATLCTLLVLAFGLAAESVAQQEVTIREINDIPDDSLAVLQSLGSDASLAQITSLTTPPLLGEEVSFTAVVLTDPLSSGLATPSGGVPGRIHMFVRDVAAEDEGYEGMGIQIVDGSRSIETLLVGDIVNFTGEVQRFGLTIQVAPSSFSVIDAADPSDPIMQPITISTEDAHDKVGEGETYDRMLFDWENFEALNNQYVRFENAQIISSTRADQGRPFFLISSPETETLVDSDDISLRYRNDRTASYSSTYNVRPADDPFIPPPAGAFVNVQGFLIARGSNFNYPDLGDPPGAIFSLAPFADDDIEITETPPVFGAIAGPDGIPGNEDVTISAVITPDPERTVTGVTLKYNLNGEDAEVAMTNTSGDTYEGTIPAAADGEFVTYFIEATDSQGAVSTSPTQTYRVLYDGITAIEHIQRTASGGVGSSPFVNFTTDMNIEGVVMSDPATSGLLTIQDDPDLGPWSGVFVDITLDIAGLNLERGDRVTISNATIAENFGLTRLDNATIERTSTGEPYGYKVVPTGVLAQDNATAEAHEGMALRFAGVTVTSVNADAPNNNFGEFRVSSDATEVNSVRVDDASDSFPFGFNDELEVGDTFDFAQGLWTYTFSNYKLLPETVEDLGLAVSNEDDALAGAFELEPAYPNPFAGSTTLRFTTVEQGAVRLDVFDIVGRRVATLVDGPLAPATHTVTLDARGLAGGTYVVRLQAGDRVTTQKLVLVK